MKSCPILSPAEKRRRCRCGHPIAAAGKPEAQAEGIRVASPETTPHSARLAPSCLGPQETGPPNQTNRKPIAGPIRQSGETGLRDLRVKPEWFTAPERPIVDTCSGTVRGHPRPLAGRSLRVSMPSAHSEVPTLSPSGLCWPLTPAPWAWANPHGVRCQKRQLHRSPGSISGLEAAIRRRFATALCALVFQGSIDDARHARPASSL